MKKPTHQWETRVHRARRVPLDALPDSDTWAWVRRMASLAGPRAEALALEFFDGREWPAWCELDRQVVDAAALAADPDLGHALDAWVFARGGRSRRRETPDGVGLAEGPLTALGLSSVAPDSSAPGRLISLCPSNAELLDALGVFDRVIACEDSSDHPPAVASVERLGPDLGPDLDRVAALAPELVLSSLTVPGMERNVVGLRARGVPQLVLAPRSLAEVFEEIEVAAAALGVPEAGRELRARMEGERDALLAARPSRSVPVYLEWWPRPMFTPGRDCYSNELIALAGGHNVFGTREGSSLEVGPDELLEAAPEVCFVSWCGVSADKLDPQRLIGRPGLETLGAARAGRVYPLDERFSGRPGPRMLEAARIMSAVIRELA